VELPDEDDVVSVRARDTFDIPWVYPVQRYAICNALESTDQIVILPTGSGKSLCFQLPALLLPALTVVVVPLISLLRDQLTKLHGLGIDAECLRGGQTPGERNRIAKAIRAGGVKIIYTTPESLLSPSAQRVLRDTPVSHLVVDEAHCVSEWGQSFRPSYLRIGEIPALLGVSSVSAFTATASPRVVRRIREIVFREREPRVFSSNPDRPNIFLEAVFAVSRIRAVSVAVGALERPLIVFSRSRAGCERLARELRRRFAGVECYFYHAGLSRRERKGIEQWFLGSKDGMLVATSAYGMGVDKPNIRTAIHADVPPSPEAYLQESGRAGRDGKPARACLVWSPADAAFGQALTDPVARERFGHMLRYARSTRGCRREVLLRTIGVEEVTCAGCDVCRGDVEESAEGRAQILSFVRRYARRYSPRQAVFALSGRPSYEAEQSGLRRLRGFGALQGWQPGDIEEAIQTMLAAGDLRVASRGPWKGRLSAGSRCFRS